MTPDELDTADRFHISNLDLKSPRAAITGAALRKLAERNNFDSKDLSAIFEKFRREILIKVSKKLRAKDTESDGSVLIDSFDLNG